MDGFKGMMDALQAAALRVKLRHLPKWNDARRRHAEYYCRLLKDVEEIRLPKNAPGCLSVNHLFVVQINNRKHVLNSLRNKGIHVGLHYPLPLHLQKAYSHLNLPEGSFPEAERSAKHIISLPMYPELTKAQIEYVCNQLKTIVIESDDLSGTT
jgi:dTDP-4-amino-4,6-dideoxygalactose transaminase